MKKMEFFPDPLFRKIRKKWLVSMRNIIVLLFALSIPLNASVLSQEKVTLKLSNVSVKQLIKAIESQTDLGFLYNLSEVKELNNISIDAEGVSVDEVLEQALKNTNLTYEIDKNIIIIKPLPIDQQQNQGQLVIKGRILDEEGNPLPGATIIEVGSPRGFISDDNGLFTMQVKGSESSIKISFIGFETQTVVIGNQRDLKIALKPSVSDISEVVVNGIFRRKESSYTGSSTSLSAKDLKRVGSANVFQALKNLDPTMAFMDNFDLGSNPSVMPEIQIRGTSTFTEGTGSSLNSNLKGNYLKDANQPLFIVDGFEASVEQVFDMDMDRIESVTILKDASAKAVYGSKAANGVVVLETKKLLTNETRVTYNSYLDIEMPDLSSYNLANASEKLQAEVIDGMYIPSYNDADDYVDLQQLYNSRKKLVLQGLDTDWISKPVQTGVGTKQSLTVEMGSENLKVIGDISYKNVNGAMKGSYRNNFSGRLNLSYRVKSLLFKNIVSVNSNNSEESPYGTFSDYAIMNPYWRSENVDGSIPFYAEQGPNGEKYPNPLYNSTLNTKIASTYFNFTDNFYLEWKILPALKATTRIGIDVKNSDADEFYPSSHTKFYLTSIERRGSYQANNGKSTNFSGDFNLNYTKEVGKHFYFSNIGFNASENKYQEVIHTVEGFPSDQMNNIVFGRSYALNSTPGGIDGISRDLGFLGVFSYMYDNRFLTDLTLRSNASSLFGADKRWANFWSLGLGWNLHNENFLKGGPFNKLKVRGSIGSTGNQNFNNNASIATYSYYLDSFYQGNIGSYLENMANSYLQWESKFEYNVGLDANIKNLSLKFDHYLSYTENLITNITLPTSTGFNSVMENIGKVKNSGFEASASYMVWRRKSDFLNLSLNVATNKNEIIELSDAMRSFNEAADEQASDRSVSTPVHKYEDGVSMNAIWAVPSLGIDPATGQEIYVDQNGNTTFEWDASNMVVAGNSSPDFRGNLSLNGEIKGFGFNVTTSFRGGGQYYNQTLVNKVENVNMNYNVDKRVLTGRWLYPGQESSFKRLGSISEDLDGDGVLETHYVEKTRATSRFVQDFNQIDISAVNLYYTFSRPFLQKMNMGLERLRLSANMNEVASFSSIRIERGTYYPFARTLSFSVSATF